MEIFNSVRPDPAGMGGEGRGGDTVLILGSVQKQGANTSHRTAAVRLLLSAYLEPFPASVALPFPSFSVRTHWSNQSELGSSGHSSQEEDLQNTGL